MKKAIIIDVDGTLAIRGDRSPFDWMKVKLDTPNKPVIELVKILRAIYKIIVFSGRDEVCRNLTQEWLLENGVIYDGLFMRPNRDNRKDSIVKKELYENNIKDNYDVDYVLDDRLQVCRMWHSLGLTLLRVGDPDADF